MLYFVYILECADGSLYVGSTNNLEKRLLEHNNLKSGAHYTKIRRPVKLKYYESYKNLSEARKRENELKKLSHQQKDKLFMQASINNQKQIFKKINKTLKKLFPKIVPALRFSNQWELLVATILSAQTTDKKVNEITEKLFKKYKKLDDYVKAKLSEFEKDINGVNYYKTKAKAILENAKIIKTQYNGKVPKTMNELVRLKNVARKTANIVLSVGYDISEGIAVDTHVKRLSKLLGLTENTDPVKIEKDLMKIIPKSEWKNFNLRFVEYGRKYCPAKKHNHKKCPLQIEMRGEE